MQVGNSLSSYLYSLCNIVNNIPHIFGQASATNTLNKKTVTDASKIRLKILVIMFLMRYTIFYRSQISIKGQWQQKISMFNLKVFDLNSQNTVV